jgi:exodeoxyribonuclease VII small subunit
MPVVGIVANLTKTGFMRYFSTFTVAVPCTVAPALHGRHPMPKHPPPQPAFENALAELESIVASMEAGQLSLDESLAAYRRGHALLRQCQQTLTQAEDQLGLIERDQGNAALDKPGS